jgi:hypothetical protein
MQTALILIGTIGSTTAPLLLLLLMVDVLVFVLASSYKLLLLLIRQLSLFGQLPLIHVQLSLERLL